MLTALPLPQKNPSNPIFPSSHASRNMAGLG